jgi:hypothetical protein
MVPLMLPSISCKYYIIIHLSKKNCLYQGGLLGSNTQVNIGGETVGAQPSFCAQIQAKEADIHALSELTRALDKKVVFHIANYA